MQVFRHYDRTPPDLRGAVVAIGNFDGVHRGHQEIIAKAARLAQELGCPHAVLTFEPHPRSVFNPASEPFRLTPFRLKVRLIEALGVDALFAIPFDLDFAKQSAEDFVTSVLVEGLGVRYIVVGDNFRFGRKRLGDIDLLIEMGRGGGFGVTSVELLTAENEEAYSSSLIRDYLKTGNPTRAALLLGRYWEIEGRVQSGDRRGRTIGFPTANLPLGETLHPAYGVYAVRAGVEGSREVTWHSGVANLGLRPTVEGDTPQLEVHLFDFDEDIYGRHMRVALVDFLRPERKFDGLDALKSQIAEDSARARTILKLEEWEADWPASALLPEKPEP
jgi:riboflavin kinase/FMN adenylyltransferase